MIEYDDITELDNEMVAEACEDAADLLEGHWVQGEWYQSLYAEDDIDEPTGYAYCLEGGLAAALGLDISDMEDRDRIELMACPVYTAVLETLNHNIRKQLIDAGASEADTPEAWYGEGDLPNWNDVDGRSEQEVVDLLRATAKRVLMPDE